jgi:hypothetical protein
MRRLAVLLALLVCPVVVSAGARPGDLPRFTEAREAAALFFLKKHVPEMLPVLDRLKQADLPRYQQEIREVFQVTELLADLQDEPRRHDLELRIWKAESRAAALAAGLAGAADAERRKTEAALRDLARELVELDVQVLELKAAQLDKELGETRDELARARDSRDRQVKERYEQLLARARRRK